MLVLILLVLGVRGCLDARKERAMKEYVRDVQALLQESDQQSRALFDLLEGSGGREQAVEIENALNGFRVESARLVDRARNDIDRPDEMSTAHRFLVQMLEFRRDGLAEIADKLPVALGDQERRKGTEGVAAQMLAFITSDVLYTQRVRPNLRAPLEDEGIAAEVQLPDSRFLPDVDWLQPEFVARQVGGIRTGRGGDEPAAPGLHGNGIASVSLGGQALAAGGSAGVKASEDLKFQVQVQNQGENTETDVLVRITVGRGGDAIEIEETVDEIAAGESKTVEVPLTESPPTGQSVPIEVTVEPVPGEKKTDNNTLKSSAIFTG